MGQIEKTNIGIVGAGQASITFLKALLGMPNYVVKGVCDLSNTSPGMVFGKRNRIYTTTNMEELVKRCRVHVILELTGSAKVLSLIEEMKLPGQEIVSSKMAKMMYDIIEQSNDETKATVTSFLTEIDRSTLGMKEAIRPIEETHSQIGLILREMHIINTNASIEATQLGDRGLAFSIIVERIAELNQDIKKSLELIAKAGVTLEESLKGLLDTRNSLSSELTKKE